MYTSRFCRKFLGGPKGCLLTVILNLLKMKRLQKMHTFSWIQHISKVLKKFQSKNFKVSTQNTISIEHTVKVSARKASSKVVYHKTKVFF